MFSFIFHPLDEKCKLRHTIPPRQPNRRPFGGCGGHSSGSSKYRWRPFRARSSAPSLRRVPFPNSTRRCARTHCLRRVTSRLLPSLPRETRDRDSPSSAREAARPPIFPNVFVAPRTCLRQGAPPGGCVKNDASPPRAPPALVSSTARAST